MIQLNVWQKWAEIRIAVPPKAQKTDSAIYRMSLGFVVRSLFIASPSKAKQAFIGVKSSNF